MRSHAHSFIKGSYGSHCSMLLDSHILLHFACHPACHLPTFLVARVIFFTEASLGFDYDALWGCSVVITNTCLSFPQLFHEVGFTVDQRLGGKQKFQLGELPSWLLVLSTGSRGKPAIGVGYQKRTPNHILPTTQFSRASKWLHVYLCTCTCDRDPYAGWWL